MSSHYLSDSRKITNKLIELVDNGELDARTVLMSAITYMSEAAVVDMANHEGYITTKEEPEVEDEPDELDRLIELENQREFGNDTVSR
jgi:hypothetical protein